MSRFERLLDRAVEPPSDAFERLTRRRRQRVTRKRLGAVMLAISVAATGSIIAFRALRPQTEQADQPPAYRVGQVTRFRLPHLAQPIAAGLGAGWALSLQTESEDINSLYRLDPNSGEVREIDLAPANPEAVVVGEGSVWVAACETTRRVASACPGGRTSLLRLDPENGAILGRTELPGHFADLSIGGGSLWVDAVILGPYRRVVIRVDARTTELTVHDCCADGEGRVDSYSAGWLWGGLFAGNTALQVDPLTFEIHRTFHDLCLISPWEAVVLAAECDKRQMIIGRLDPIKGRFVASPIRSEAPMWRFPKNVVATGSTGWFLERSSDAVFVRRFDPDGTVGGPWRVPVGPGRFSDLAIGPEPLFVAAEAEGGAFWINDFSSGQVLRVAIEAS